MDTRRNSKWTKIKFLIAVPLMLMACSLSSAIPATSTNVPPTATLAAPTAQSTETPALTTAPQPINLLPGVQLPQSFTYADLSFSITRAVITNQVSDTDPSIDPKNTYARLSLEVVNSTNLDVIIRAGRFILKLGDGTSYSKSFIDKVMGKSSGNIPIQFIIPANETWAGAQLSLDEKGTVPGVVMLDGLHSPGQYPITLAAGQILTLKTFRPMTYTINTAVMDLDGLGVRAKIGNHYLVLGITAYCNNTSSCYVGPEEMRLVVDGVPESVETLLPIATDVHFQASAVVQAAFVVPDNAGKLVFKVGEVGKENAQIPIPLK